MGGWWYVLLVVDDPYTVQPHKFNPLYNDVNCGLSVSPRTFAWKRNSSTLRVTYSISPWLFLIWTKALFLRIHSDWIAVPWDQAKQVYNFCLWWPFIYGVVVIVIPSFTSALLQDKLSPILFMTSCWPLPNGGHFLLGMLQFGNIPLRVCFPEPDILL